jgi:hypothetical protein
VSSQPTKQSEKDICRSINSWQIGFFVDPTHTNTMMMTMMTMITLSSLLRYCFYE